MGTIVLTYKVIVILHKMTSTRIICHLARSVKLGTACPASRCIPLMCQHRNMATNKHWDPKWRKQRAQKVYIPEALKEMLRQEEEHRQFGKEIDPARQRERLKKEGRLPPRNSEELGIILGCTGDVFEQFVPPEGDGVASIVSKDGVKDRGKQLLTKGNSWRHARKIQAFDDDFETTEFADEGYKIYCNAQNLLQNFEENEDDLHDLVTEKAWPELVYTLKKKTFRWKMIEQIEPPRVVHVRTTHLLNKENLYGQVTVRFHTKQIMAIYDRFGRIMFGSENIARDCLEYVVFEKHLANIYGKWRVHAKIIPEWLPARTPSYATKRMPDFEPIDEEEEKEDGKDHTAAASILS